MLAQTFVVYETFVTHCLIVGRKPLAHAGNL